MKGGNVNENGLQGGQQQSETRQQVQPSVSVIIQSVRGKIKQNGRSDIKDILGTLREETFNEL